MNRLLALVACLSVVLFGWGVYSSGQSSLLNTRHGLLTPVSAESKIRFVPIEDFPVRQLESLARHYRAKFNIEISIAKSVPIPPELHDYVRGQVKAEALASSLRRALPEYAQNTILIGFTSEDIYPISQNWRFAFGWRIGETRSAVVSTARMALVYPGMPADRNIAATRLRKVVTKDIGIFYYGLPLSSNPRSVLYNQIMGIQELDEVGEDF